MADWHTLVRERDFPMLDQAECDGRAVIYLDNAATTQCARPVQWALENFWQGIHANPYRGAYCLSRQADRTLEETRQVCAEFIGAADRDEIVFTRGATDSANLLADAFALTELHAGDLVLATELEHHSNLLPWREACHRTGAEFELVPITGTGELDLDALDWFLSRKPKLLALCAVSNVLGTVNPVKEIVSLCHRAGCAVAVDAAQAMRSGLPWVQALDCDFLYFSAHKLMGPTGIGILYMKREWLERLTPPRVGGGMVRSFRGTEPEYEQGPLRFEAGTLDLGGVAGLGAAMEYLHAIGRRRIAARENALLRYTEKKLREIPGVRVLGSPAHRFGLVSFTAEPLQPLDIALMLDSQGIAVRSGNHCAIPLHQRLGLTGSVRVSPAFYNTAEEIDALAAALERTLDSAGRNISGNG